MHRFYLLSILSIWVCCLSAQQVIQLNSTPTPSDLSWEHSEGESFFPNSTERFVHNVAKPSLTAYLPDPSNANGTALIIAPGGGFHFLSIDNEGLKVAKWCTQNGIAAFVLRYRLVPTYGNPMQEFRNKLQAGQEELDRSMAPFIALAKADGQAAIEYVRANNKRFNVNPKQIGVIGFSAGGTVAAAAAFESGSGHSRPDFSVPIYPALHLVNTEVLPSEAIPVFMAVTADDAFGFQTLSADLFKQLNAKSHPVELHIYEKGGHGFGMKAQNLPSDQWTDALAAWMADHGWIPDDL